MIVYAPIVLFLIGLLLAYGSAGVRRQAGTALMVGAASWALAFLVDPRAFWWGAGPLLGTLLLPRPRERVPSSFETLTGRTLTLAVCLVFALFIASRLRVGENPLLLNAVPWFLLATGAAWVVRSIDARERIQGQVLLVAGIAAVLLAAVPAGPVTGLAAGAMAVVPVLGERARLPATWRPLLSPLGLALAGVAAAVAATRLSIPHPSVADLSFDFAGSALLAVVLVLLAGILLTPLGDEWAAVLAVVAVLATAPSLRWSAIAALVAISTLLERVAERPAWLAVLFLASGPALQALAPAAFSPRLATVTLAVGLLLMIYAARAGLLRVMVLPATVFVVLALVESLTSGNLTRFQWIAAAGALLLIGRAVLFLVRSADPPAVIREPLVFGLLLLAISARDALGLGAVAVVLLLVDLAVVRPTVMSASPGPLPGRFLTLMRSSWPPSVTFAGATLAVIAALQASLALGLLAALMLAGLQVAPLLDRNTGTSVAVRPRSSFQWIPPAISIVCGIAPAVVLRMLRL